MLVPDSMLALRGQAYQLVAAVYHIFAGFHEAEALFVVAVDRAKVRKVPRHEGLRCPGTFGVLSDVLVLVGRDEQEHVTYCRGIVSRNVRKGLRAFRLFLLAAQSGNDPDLVLVISFQSRI